MISYKKILKFIFFISWLILFWQFLARSGKIPSYFLPAPYEVLKVFHQQAFILLKAASVSLLEALIGLFLAIFTGGLTGLLLYRFRLLHFLFWPVLVLSQGLPTLVLAPLLILWFGYGIASKIILVIIFLFFPIATAMFDGLMHVNVLWLKLGRCMTKNQNAILWHIQLPAALAHLASGIRISSAGAMMAAIVGEWLGANQGLGFLLLESNARFQTDEVFALTATIIALSFLIYGSIHYLLKLMIRY